MSYGRHQSFYIKEHWINKGMKSFSLLGERFLFDKDNFRNMGIGKNMHQSLRFWLEAAYIFEPNKNEKYHSLTPFGLLLSLEDPSCSMEISKNLCQYFLSLDDTYLDKEVSTGLNWFFRKLEEDFFSKDKLLSKLISFDKGKTSEKTLSREIDCILASYTNKSKSHPEDKNFSLLSDLDLVQKQGGSYYKTPVSNTKLSDEAILFILLFMRENDFVLTIDEILNSEIGLGKSFNLSRLRLLERLEEMVLKGYSLGITRTNNIDIVSLEENTLSFQYLEGVYRRGEQDEQKS